MEIKLSKEEQKFIKDNFDIANELMKGSVDNLLLGLDDLITARGFDDNYDLNDFGRKAQKIYDSIYNNNV